MTTHPSHVLPPGARIDKYEIQSVLGEGGFGITYKGIDTVLEMTVAIKEYLPVDQAIRDSSTQKVSARTNREDDFNYGRDQFLEEGKRLAKFSSQHIVRVVDFKEANGTAYLVMTYEQGQSLGDYLKSHSDNIPETHIISWIKDILEGLVEIHAEGMLHRDIKPDNIYLRDKKDEALLIDFGSSRYALGAHSKSISAIISQGYAPPEQYRTRGQQGPQTDLYAVGATLYRLLTGDTPLESLERHHDVSDDLPDPLAPVADKAQGNYSPWLLELTNQLLTLKFADRPADAQQVLDALKNRHALDANSDKTRRVNDQDRFSEGVTRKVKDEGRWQETTNAHQETRSFKAPLISVVVVLIVIIGYVVWDGQQQVDDSRPSPDIVQVKPRLSVPEKDTEIVKPAKKTEIGSAILSVKSEPAGADVYLDEKLLGKTPLYRDDLLAGQFSLKVIHPDTKDISRSITLTDNFAEKHDFKLEPATGNVTLLSKPENAWIKLDGKDTGKKTPATFQALSVGLHTITLGKDRYYNKQGEVRIKKNETLKMTLELEGGHLVKYKGKWVEPAEKARIEAEKAKELADKKLQKQLSTCEAHFNANRLTNPEEKNALACYRSVITQYPNNQIARQGVKNILNKYQEWFVSSLDKNELGKADAHLERIKQINPQYPDLVKLQQALVQARIKEEKRLAEAKARQKKQQLEEYLLHAEASLKKKQLKQAESLINRASKLDPNNQQLISLRSKLKKLKERKPYEPVMVKIPAGSYMMGCVSKKGCQENETPIHKVHIKAFEIGKYEVTQAQWNAVMGYNTSKEPNCDKCPVAWVSWREAQSYIKKLNNNTGKKYRLPSESEWEYVVRAGTETQYYWGNSFSFDHANAGGFWGGKTEGKDRWETESPVGSFEPNSLGVFDMHGNIYEWVQDCWNNNYKNAPIDGKPWKTGNCNKHILRGGAWSTPLKYIRSAYRHQTSDGNYSNVGFRLARDLGN